MSFTIDHAGNPCCGQDFMAGTICSLPPGHPGPHGADCQTCGGDWINETCTCLTKCIECGTYFDPTDDEAGWGDHCWGCTCDHIGEYDFGPPRGVGEAQCYLAIGHEGPHRYTREEPMPVSDEEIAAAVASIEKDMPAVVIAFKTCIDCGKSIGCLMGGDPPTCKTHN